MARADGRAVDWGLGMKRRGQALVETALALPLCVFACLAILQLTSIQRARVYVEYAVQVAARTGIVWNGNISRMRDAALLALLPTVGKADSPEALTSTWKRASLAEALDGPGLVKVSVSSPEEVGHMGAVWNVPGGAGWQELDFDGPDTFIPHAELDRHYPSFLDSGPSSPSQKRHRRATLLPVQIEYLYEMKVPVANAAFFWGVYARRQASGGARSGEQAELAARTRGSPPRYYLKLQSEYVMRMQSNVYRKWVDHGP